MRVVVELDGVRSTYDMAGNTPQATLADLVASATGTTTDPGAHLWVDDHRYPADTPVDDLRLLEGVTISRAPAEQTVELSGWTARVAGGLGAGRVVAIPANRPLTIGRAPTADLTIDSPSASWSHATVAIETRPGDERPGDEDEPDEDSHNDDSDGDEDDDVEGLRIIDVGSTNGTTVDGRRIDSGDTTDNDDNDDNDEGSEEKTEESQETGHRHRGGLRALMGRLRHPGRRRRKRRGDADEPEEGPEGVFVTEDCVVMIGGSAIVLSRDLAETPAPRPGSLHNETASATVPFNRPPRPGAPPQPEPVTPPTRKTITDATKFSLISVLAPLVLAFVMVLVLRDARYALFCALSPILGIGTWMEQKRRHRSDTRAEDQRFDKALSTLRTDIEHAAAIERRRRESLIPDPARVMRWAERPTTRLWERRAGTQGFLNLYAGVGDAPWHPRIDEKHANQRLDNKVRRELDRSRLVCAPVEADLGDAGVVGIVGGRPQALAVARSLLIQAAGHCGPADLTIGVFADQGRGADWEWASWLPHTRRVADAANDRWVSFHRPRSETLLRGLRDGIDAHPTRAVLLVLDTDVLLEGRDAPARQLLGHGRGARDETGRPPTTQVSGIVIASAEQQLPASCTVVIRAADDAAGTVELPAERRTVDDVVLSGVDLPPARRCAQAMARFDDPELRVPGASLPSLVKLAPLLGMDGLGPDEVLESWRTSTGVSTPVGMGEGGPFSLDLVLDGPHGLVGGTTGSGKSEFLRTLVAGLAARNDPTKLTFILIDFKGGAAFRSCEALPHTIGTISNLDEQLADRAIRALEAEMRYRQRVFAEAGEGVDNLDAYLATHPARPMPRLLLVVDEFAMLAKEHPEVLSSLVSVGAVGRTLGVHMILATQRPAGVVNDDILANTNLRVALRVQSRDDSVNVVEVPDAAAIGRNQRGRALVKLGQNDITPVQTALVSAPLEAADRPTIELQPVVDGLVQAPDVAAPQSEDDDTELDLLIDSIGQAAGRAGIPTPRPVWPEPLGERVELDGFSQPGDEQLAEDQQTTGAGQAAEELPRVGAVRGTRVEFALSDDPDHQRQIPASWDMSEGNLLLLGIPGSGTTTALAAIALTLARSTGPDDLDLLVLDMGSRGLSPLAGLPHTAGYVGAGANSAEQQARFLKYLRAEVDRRREQPGPHRRMVVLIDGLATLKDEYQDYVGQELLGHLFRAYADGPDLGMSFAVTSTRSKSVPTAIDEVTTQKWLFRLADPYDYSAVGVQPKQAPAAVPGRCVPVGSHLQTHVATPPCPLEGAVARISAGRSGKQSVIGQLPSSVSIADVQDATTIESEPWRIPVGIRESDLEPALAELYEGEHMLIAGVEAGPGGQVHRAPGDRAGPAHPRRPHRRRPADVGHLRPALPAEGRRPGAGGRRRGRRRRHRVPGPDGRRARGAAHRRRREFSRH